MIYRIRINFVWVEVYGKKFTPSLESCLKESFSKLDPNARVEMLTNNIFDIITKLESKDIVGVFDELSIPIGLVSISDGIDENDYSKVISSLVLDDTEFIKSSSSEEESEEEPKDPFSESNEQEEEKEVEEEPEIKQDLASIISTVHKLRNVLTSKVMGQNHVIEQVLNSYFGMMAMPENKKSKKPRGVFLFAGPPGVGKTMMANLIADELDMPSRIFQMSEYSSHTSADTLTGTNGTYKNSGPGKLTDFVDKNPKCILVFDEIEKAHSNILNIFLQILDNGIVADTNTQKDVSFKDTIIILTSNVGRNLYEDDSINIPNLNKKMLVNSLSTDINPATNAPYFSTALLSRLSTGTICMFNKLEPYFLRLILANELNNSFEVFSKAYDINVNISEDVTSLLLYSLGGNADARGLVGLAETFVKKELFDLLDLAAKGKVDINNIKNINLTMDENRCPNDIKALLIPNEVSILFICKPEVKEVISKLGLPNTNIICATTIEEAKQKLRGSLSLVVVDLLLNVHDGEMPACLEDVYSDGVDLFNYIKDYHNDVALYILNDASMGYDDQDYQAFLAYNARGIIHFNNESLEPIINDIELIKAKALVEKSSNELRSSNNLISYNCAQYFKEDTVDVKLQRLALRRNIQIEDNSDILSDLSKPSIKFSDVIGAEDAKDTLRDFLKYLKDPKKYTETGVRPPRGVLLYGPPGTGKTLLAKALAGESNVTFIQKNSTEFFKRFVGQGPEAVRNMFKQARKYAPAIIFIDECDAFAKKRTGSEGGRHEEEILTTFLSELDGFVFNDKKPVLVVVATNYEISGEGNTVLDPAFVRRFDRKICIGLPNTEERQRFLEYYLNKHSIKTISKQTIENIALRTYGYSPANLEMIVELAIRNAKGEDVTDELLTESVDLDRNGKEQKWNEDVVRSTSYHEAGHTLVAWLCGTKPTFVTNVSRGDYGGYMVSEIDESKMTYNRQDMLDRICCSLGGRAAEIVIYGEEAGITTGASGDLKNATYTARLLISRYGMNNSLVSYGPNEFGPTVEEKLYNDINAILAEQLSRAIELIKNNRGYLEELTNELIKKNSLSKNEIESILSRRMKND